MAEDQGWTAQTTTSQNVAQDEEAQGPQMFTKEQLPNPEVARQAGLAPQAIPVTQVLEDEDEAYAHPRGPEPGEIERSKKRAAVAERLDDGVSRQDLDDAAINDDTTQNARQVQQRRSQRAEERSQDRDEDGQPRDPAGAQEDSRRLEDEATAGSAAQTPAASGNETQNK